MSRRNSRFQKSIRREMRQADKDRAMFIHEVSQEEPIVEGKEMRFKNRKERRGGG